MEAAGCGERLVHAPDISLIYALFRCADAVDAGGWAASAPIGLIEYRLWYGAGLHSNDYFAGCRRDPLPFDRSLRRQRSRTADGDRS